MRKRQQISQQGLDLYSTIPQKAVAALDITPKRFFEWTKTSTELIGTLCRSETVVTTRIREKRNQCFVEILSAYVKQYGITPTKKGGPMAAFEWDDTTLQVRIPLTHKDKKRGAKTGKTQN